MATGGCVCSLITDKLLLHLGHLKFIFPLTKTLLYFELKQTFLNGIFTLGSFFSCYFSFANCLLFRLWGYLFLAVSKFPVFRQWFVVIVLSAHICSSLKANKKKNNAEFSHFVSIFHHRFNWRLPFSFFRFSLSLFYLLSSTFAFHLKFSSSLFTWTETILPIRHIGLQNDMHSI